MIYADSISDDYDNVYHVAINNKIFDVFYSIDNGSIDELDISSNGISFTT